VIIGGGLRPQTSEIWQKIVDLAGGRGARIAVFGSASETPKDAAQDAITSLDAVGAHAFFVPVALKLPGSNAVRAARDRHNVQLVLKAHGIFFTGGDQGRITQVLRDAHGAPTPVLRAIWQLYRRGGVIAGTSAGAAVMSKTMFFEPRETLEILRSGPILGQDLGPGLGFLNTGIMIDQHALVRSRFARMLSAMAATGDSVGLGVDEDTAAVVVRGRPTELIGRSGAVLIHRSGTTQIGSVSPLQVDDVSLSILAAGDSLDLNAGLPYPSAQKLRGAIAATASPAPGVIGAPDGQFRNANIPTDALEIGGLLRMAVLASTGPTGASSGVAGKIDVTKSDQIAFELRLESKADSHAYFVESAPLGGFTLTNLHLTIRPIVQAKSEAAAPEHQAP
jgi:cyanophycinase